MADTYTLLIQPGTVSITRVADNSTVFSSNYNYMHYDSSGNIKWPVSPTMSSAGGNLTWQFNGQQVVIGNTYYAAGAKAFDTYLLPLVALNPSITASSFSSFEGSSRESTSNAV
jgi:hypothetical protein